MFAKVFTQIFDSSIAENPELRFTFTDLLTLADMNGVVDMTHEAIARRTNRPVDVIRANIAELEQPDLRSRTARAGGRRLSRLDDHRDWGWVIVNYDTFRMTASEEQRREKTRERVSRFRDKHEQTAPSNAPVTHGNAPVTQCDAGNAMQKQRQKQREKQKEDTNSLAALAESIYEAYPKKVGRPVALRAIEKALKSTDHETLLAATVAYAKARAGQDAQFTPMPATWFNQQRYNDDQSSWTNAPEVKQKERNERSETLTLKLLKPE